MNTEKKPKQLIYSKGGYITNGGEQALRLLAQERGLALSSLIGYAIDNEFEKEFPFQANYSLPDDEYIENAYADEAGKIISFMKSYPTPFWLEKFALLRFDMGIPSKTRFLYGFRECLMTGLVVSFFTEDPNRTRKDEPYYRLKEIQDEVDKKKKVKRTKEEKMFDDYIRLQKKLKEKGLLDGQ